MLLQIKGQPPIIRQKIKCIQEYHTHLHNYNYNNFQLLSFKLGPILKGVCCINDRETSCRHIRNKIDVYIYKSCDYSPSFFILQIYSSSIVCNEDYFERNLINFSRKDPRAFENNTQDKITLNTYCILLASFKQLQQLLHNFISDTILDQNLQRFNKNCVFQYILFWYPKGDFCKNHFVDQQFFSIIHLDMLFLKTLVLYTIHTDSNSQYKKNDYNLIFSFFDSSTFDSYIFHIIEFVFQALKKSFIRIWFFESILFFYIFHYSQLVHEEFFLTEREFFAFQMLSLSLLMFSDTFTPFQFNFSFLLKLKQFNYESYIYYLTDNFCFLFTTLYVSIN